MLAAVAAAVGLTGCDLEAPEADFEPAPRLVEAWVTTRYEDGEPVRAELQEDRRLTGVRRSASVVLRFDRFLLPSSVLRQAICVRPSTDAVERLEDCSRPAQPFLEPVYSPARRQVIFYQTEGESLAADTLYRLTVFPPTEESDFGFRAFDGRPLDRIYRFDFTTADDDSEQVRETPPTPERYCDARRCAEQCRSDPASSDDPAAQQACIDARCACLDASCTNDGDLTDPSGGVFATSCAFGGCHAGGDAAVGIPWGTGDAAMGLDLASPAAIAATAIGRAAHQTQTGERAAIATINATPFGRAMPIVAPSNPGNSYLVYKLIVQSLNHPRPEGILDPTLVAGIERLRGAFVMGTPMRPDDALLGLSGDADGERAWRRLLLMEDWIAHGAVTSCSPSP